MPPFSMALLEGRDRIGGRTYIGEALGGQFELGGTYVHWTHPTLPEALNLRFLTTMLIKNKYNVIRRMNMIIIYN